MTRIAAHVSSESKYSASLCACVDEWRLHVLQVLRQHATRCGPPSSGGRGVRGSARRLAPTRIEVMRRRLVLLRRSPPPPPTSTKGVGTHCPVDVTLDVLPNVPALNNSAERCRMAGA